MYNTRRDNNITTILRGPQGRLFLDIQVISNFFEVIDDLRTNDDRQNELTILALRNLLLFLSYFIGPLTPLTNIVVSRNVNETLNAIYLVDFWPNTIERPWSHFQSRFETVYRTSGHIPWFITRPYELRGGTNIKTCV